MDKTRELIWPKPWENRDFGIQISACTCCPTSPASCVYTIVGFTQGGDKGISTMKIHTLLIYHWLINEDLNLHLIFCSPDNFSEYLEVEGNEKIALSSFALEIILIPAPPAPNFQMKSNKRKTHHSFLWGCSVIFFSWIIWVCIFYVNINVTADVSSVRLKVH